MDGAGNRQRTTRNPVVLQKIAELEGRYPEARLHREALQELDSDFVYAAPVRDDKRFRDVWIVLVRLAPTLEDRFGIHREIIGVYTPHADLQGRTVKRIPELFKVLPPERRGLVRNVAFVWSSDIRLQTKLDQLSSTDFVVVPFIGEGGPDLLKTLASRLYSQDLYREKNYVTGDQFFGRRPILQALRSDFQEQKIAGLFGTRKTGKTSILQELVATSREHADETFREVYIYLDMEDIPSVKSGDPIPGLIEDLSEKIRRGLKDVGARTRELADISRDPTVRNFRTALSTLLQHRDNVDVSLVVILDEIEHLCPPNCNDNDLGPDAEKVPQFFGALRKMVQELDNFNFAIAGLAPAIIESGHLYGRPNPLYSVANPYYLSPFSRDEAAELLNGIGARIGVNWTDGAVDSAYIETGGQVVLLRELGSHVWECIGKDRTEAVVIEENDVKSILSAYRRSVRSQIDETMKYIQQYYPREFELALELINDPEEFVDFAEQYEAESNRLLNLGLAQQIGTTWEPSRILQIGLVGKFSGKVVETDSSLLELMSNGEGATLEFKSSARTPIGQQVDEVIIVESFIKAIAGFLNARGGTLLIGVDDRGNILGLDKDLARFSGSEDKMLRYVVDKINSYLGNVAGSLVRVDFSTVRRKRIMRIDVPKSDELVFLEKSISGKDHQLYVRQGANIKELTGKEMLEYGNRRHNV